MHSHPTRDLLTFLADPYSAGLPRHPAVRHPSCEPHGVPSTVCSNATCPASQLYKPPNQLRYKSSLGRPEPPGLKKKPSMAGLVNTSNCFNLNHSTTFKFVWSLFLIFKVYLFNTCTASPTHLPPPISAPPAHDPSPDRSPPAWLGGYSPGSLCPLRLSQLGPLTLEQRGPLPVAGARERDTGELGGGLSRLSFSFPLPLDHVCLPRGVDSLIVSWVRTSHPYFWPHVHRGLAFSPPPVGNGFLTQPHAPICGSESPWDQMATFRRSKI